MSQIISYISVWFISAVYGLESGWSGPALKFLSSSKSPFLITPIDITWLSITTTAGNIISIIVCTIAAEFCGRKPLFFTCCVILSAGWMLNCFADTFFILLISKFLINVGLGIFDVLNCIYMSEVSSSESRGVVVSISMVFYTVGTEFEYIVGLFQNYTLLSVVPLVVSILATICSYFVVESPYFLIMNGKSEEAYKNLCLLEGTVNREKITRGQCCQFSGFQAIPSDFEHRKPPKNVNLAASGKSSVFDFMATFTILTHKFSISAKKYRIFEKKINEIELL